MLTAKEIRRRFLEYFKAHGHEIVHSAPLIPRDDPSLLFTNAGMVPFKKLFLGQEIRPYVRAASSQKCLRVSGKHNDLENVGRTARHHTFFEMLGNFSFGDYFKKEGIEFAWNFITKELKLPEDKLYVTVYEEDDEAFNLWQEVAGLSSKRIFRMDEKNNFWAMGDTGPCGPCSEIFIDQGEDMSCGAECAIDKCDCDRFLEIWNLVFMQFEQPADGPRQKLPSPSIDTGMGLERIAAVCQGKKSNYDCDLFQEIIQYAASLAGQTYGFSAPNTNDVDTALRVIADHSRAAAFLIADGTLPSNEGRGYVLRRLIRRALRFGNLMGLTEPFLHKTVAKVSEIMSEDFPELNESPAFLIRVVREEEERFSLTLEKGLILLEEEFCKLAAATQTTILGDICFKLYDTFGFPLDIVNDIAAKKGFHVDEPGFKLCMQVQRDRARASQKSSGLLSGQNQNINSLFAPLIEGGLQSEFVGYDNFSSQSRIIALLDANGLSVEALTASNDKDTPTTGFMVSTRTPFYGASGGQEGDSGNIATPSGEAIVVDTLKPALNLTVHCISMKEGDILLDQELNLNVTSDKRLASARNHTCTHLLHSALRRTLGKHVKQAGSLVAHDRLRFDFLHISALSPDELKAIEYDVNRAIMSALSVCNAELSYAEAIESGAIALFSEKYGNYVRVVSIGGEQDRESVELCGGTHLANTGQAGAFVILSEAGIAAGTRRIEALTGFNALNYLNQTRQNISKISQMLKVKPDDTVLRVQALQDEIKKLRKASTQPTEQSISTQGHDILAKEIEISGIKFIAAKLGTLPIKSLREIMDDIRSKVPSGIICLSAINEDKINVILYVSKDLHQKFTAPVLIKEIAVPIGGSGGGRPDLAQAGGSNPDGIEETFELLKNIIKSR